MTPDEALEHAIHIYGGYVWCGGCNNEIWSTTYEAANQGKEYNEPAFGQFLKDLGWQFVYQVNPFNFFFLCADCQNTDLPTPPWALKENSRRPQK